MSTSHSRREADRSSPTIAADPQRRESEGQFARELALPLFHNPATLVNYIKEARRLRNDFFEPELFGEPGWDILLDLYEAQLNQRRLPISAVGLGSGVRLTTTIRWLNSLEANDLICREPDPLDARRVFVSLTAKAMRNLNTMFAALWEKMAELQRER